MGLPEDLLATQAQSLKRKAKAFLSMKGQLLRRTVNGLKAVVPISMRTSVMNMFHDDNGHWDLRTTTGFITELFWWPQCYKYIAQHVKSCYGCKMSKPQTRYRSTLKMPVEGLFHTSSLGFDGPLPATKRGNGFLLIGVEHVTGWPVAQPY